MSGATPRSGPGERRYTLEHQRSSTMSDSVGMYLNEIGAVPLLTADD